MIPRPTSAEHAPFYAGYIALVPDGDLIAGLGEQPSVTADLVTGALADRGDFAYAPGKWTVKEVLGHIGDAERVMAYRALRFARRDETPLAGFDENLWVPHGGFARRTTADLLDELRAVREATIQLARHLDGDALARCGSANGKLVSVRALLYIIAGHERHHVNILRERYAAG